MVEKKTFVLKGSILFFTHLPMVIRYASSLSISTILLFPSLKELSKIFILKLASPPPQVYVEHDYISASPMLTVFVDQAFPHNSIRYYINYSVIWIRFKKKRCPIELNHCIVILEREDGEWSKGNPWIYNFLGFVNEEDRSEKDTFPLFQQTSSSSLLRK